MRDYFTSASPKGAVYSRPGATNDRPYQVVLSCGGLAGTSGEWTTLSTFQDDVWAIRTLKIAIRSTAKPGKQLHQAAFRPFRGGLGSRQLSRPPIMLKGRLSQVARSDGI
jgi:hypothetical protein